MELEGTIGKGNFAVVKLTTHIVTKTKVSAVMVIRRSLTLYIVECSTVLVKKKKKKKLDVSMTCTTT